MKKIILLVLISFISFNIINANETFVSEIFLKRHSGKSYDGSRQVTLEQIDGLIEAARWAPSSHNDQPWNFIICEKSLTPEAYAKAFSSLKAATQQKWAVNAPLLIIIVARTKELYDGKLNYWNEFDTGSAAVSMALQAADLGLMAHQVGGFNKEMIRKEFQLPEDCKPMTIMIVGYEMAEENPAPRERRPVGSNFFLGEWGVPYK